MCISSQPLPVNKTSEPWAKLANEGAAGYSMLAQRQCTFPTSAAKALILSRARKSLWLYRFLRVHTPPIFVSTLDVFLSQQPTDRLLWYVLLP